MHTFTAKAVPLLPIVILFNPKAGKQRSGAIAAKLSAFLEQRNIAHEVFGEGWPEDLSNYSAAWVIGGDGTVNYLINHVRGELPPMAVFKGGTGNDLATLLYGNVSVEATAERVLAASPKPLDAGCSNGRFFLNMCGIGFDGEVLKNMKTIRWLGPFFGYWWAIVKGVLSYREPTLSISVGEEAESKVFPLLLLISNAPTTGGGFRVSPLAKPNDGCLDLVTIGKLRVVQRLRYLPKVRRGEHLGLPFVEHRQVRTLRITSALPIHAQLDGELISAKEFSITICPGKFRFLY